MKVLIAHISVKTVCCVSQLCARWVTECALRRRRPFSPLCHDWSVPGAGQSCLHSENIRFHRQMSHCTCGKSPPASHEGPVGFTAVRRGAVFTVASHRRATERWRRRAAAGSIEWRRFHGGQRSPVGRVMATPRGGSIERRRFHVGQRSPFGRATARSSRRRAARRSVAMKAKL